MSISLITFYIIQPYIVCLLKLQFQYLSQFFDEFVISNSNGILDFVSHSPGFMLRDERTLRGHRTKENIRSTKSQISKLSIILIVIGPWSFRVHMQNNMHHLQDFGFDFEDHIDFIYFIYLVFAVRIFFQLLNFIVIIIFYSHYNFTLLYFVRKQLILDHLFIQ